MTISPTAEGFRAAFRRPSLTLAEIMWRWVIGATAAAVFFFGLSEYLNTLPVTNGELLFLRTRHPYLMAQAIAHIFRGSLSRAMMAALVAAIMLGLLWTLVSSVGRMATVRALVEYFHSKFRETPAADFPMGKTSLSSRTASSVPVLMRLNFLRAAVILAAVVGLLGAAILSGFASTDVHPRPGVAFLLFLPLAGLVFVAAGALNWFLSLAGMFAVRDGLDAPSAISSAVSFCRERTAAIAAVSTWTGLAHFALFVVATTAVSMPLGFAGVLPWRLVLFVMILMTLAYFAVADWLYMARLAGYVCIAETPEELLRPLPPPTPPIAPLLIAQDAPAVQSEITTIQTSIDRDELILSDINPPVE